MSKSNRNKKIEFRCTEEEAAEIQKLAEANGFDSLSSYARFKLTEPVGEGSTDTAQLRDFMEEANAQVLKWGRVVSSTGSVLMQATRRITTLNKAGFVEQSKDVTLIRESLTKAPEAFETYQEAVTEIREVARQTRAVLGRFGRG